MRARATEGVRGGPTPSAVRGRAARQPASASREHEPRRPEQRDVVHRRLAHHDPHRLAPAEHVGAQPLLDQRPEPLTALAGLPVQ
ncbi:hypothetical protein GA0115246_102487, partial [Streptomyces sp. SolWspMP-sol7th]